MLAVRQLAAFQGTRILLLHGLHSEAAALVRRQFEDNLRLAWLSAHPDDTAGLYYAHLAGQLARKLSETKKLAELDIDVTEILEQLHEEEAGIEEARAEAGGPTSISWKPVAEMTSELGRNSEILMWVMMSPHVHSGVTAEGPVSSLGGELRLGTTDDNLHNRRLLADYAGRYLSESISLAAQHLGWPAPDRVSEVYSTWRTRLRAIDIVA